MDRQKIPEQPRTGGGRAFGVELCAVEIAPLHAGAEGRAVDGAGHGGRAHVQRIAVHEVRVIAVAEAGHQSTGTLYFESVPAHVRHRTLGSRRKARRAAGNDSEAACIAFVRSRDMASAAAPTPGRMTWLAARISSGSADTEEEASSRCRANCSEAMFAPPLATMTARRPLMVSLGSW